MCSAEVNDIPRNILIKLKNSLRVKPTRTEDILSMGFGGFPPVVDDNLQNLKGSKAPKPLIHQTWACETGHGWVFKDLLCWPKLDKVKPVIALGNVTTFL